MKRNFEVLFVIWIWKSIKLVRVTIVFFTYFPLLASLKNISRVSECPREMYAADGKTSTDFQWMEEKIYNSADIIWIWQHDGMCSLVIIIVDLKFTISPTDFLQIFLPDSPFPPLYYLSDIASVQSWIVLKKFLGFQK